MFVKEIASVGDVMQLSGVGSETFRDCDGDSDGD